MRITIWFGIDRKGVRKEEYVMIVRSWGVWKISCCSRRTN